MTRSLPERVAYNLSKRMTEEQVERYRDVFGDLGESPRERIRQLILEELS